MGRVSVPQAQSEARDQKIPIRLVQNAAPPTSPQAPNDPRELIPLNPNGQQPGQGQQPQPGQGQAPADCPVQIYQDGQLFTFPRPGQQPGQQPGQGQGNQSGQPGGAQELIPLNPGTPSSPGTPSAPSIPGVPNTPGSPQNPRS